MTIICRVNRKCLSLCITLEGKTEMSEHVFTFNHQCSSKFKYWDHKMPDSCKKQLKTAKDLIPQSCIKSAVLWQMAFWHSGKYECLLPPCILNSNYIEL